MIDKESLGKAIKELILPELKEMKCPPIFGHDIKFTTKIDKEGGIMGRKRKKYTAQFTAKVAFEALKENKTPISLIIRHLMRSTMARNTTKLRYEQKRGNLLSKY